MLFTRIIDFFQGYVVLYLEGIHLERFLNMAINEDIYLWDVRRMSDTTMRLKVSRKGFKRLRHLAYKTKTKVSLGGKYGYFRWRKKASARKFFLFTVLFAVLLIAFLSSLVLEIEVVGNTTVDREVILQKLSEINLKKGVFRGNIDRDKVSAKLITDLDNISWVGITEEGTKVIIEIKERRPAPVIVPKEVPCHIVAVKDAVVKNMTIENGDAAVQIGDVVTQGQVLISGIVTSEKTEPRYLHAIGSVVGKTWYEKTVTNKMYEYEKEYTQNVHTKRYIRFFDYPIRLSFSGQVPYYNYDTQTERKIFGFVTWETNRYSEYTLQRKERDEETVKKQAEETLTEQLYQTYDKEKVLSVTFTHSYNEEGELVTRLLAECEEEIGEALDFTKEMQIQEEEHADE